MHSKGNPTLDAKIALKAEKEGFVPFHERFAVLSKSSSEETIIEDTLILDPFFGSLLNQEREIEVNGVIFKITEYGTFFGNPLKLNRINEIIDSLNNNENGESGGLHSTIIIGENLVSDNLYLVEDEIYRYDTFNEDFYVEGPSLKVEPNNLKSSYTIGETLPEAFYDNLTTFPFEAHTLAGNIIESVFGRSRAHNIYFEENRRVRVNFYSVNYVVYSAIGMNVTMQKKNWIGWSPTTAQELRMGWDGMVYEYKFPYSYSGDTPVRTERTETPGVKTNLAYTVNILDSEYTLDLTQTIKTTIKGIFTYLDSHLPNVGYEAKTEALRQFRLIFPDKSIVVVDRYEESTENGSSIERVFDWGICEVKLSFLSGGQWVFNAGMENNALEFNVKSVSIYGLAKYNNQWNGCRIINTEPGK